MLPPLERPEQEAFVVPAAKARRRESLAEVGRGLFFIAHNASNVLNYAFLLAMSRALAPADFALFAALFGSVYLASALANTIQTSVAAAVAGASPQAAEAVVGSAIRRLALSILPFGAAVLIAARPVAAFLHTDDLTSVALTGMAIWLSLLAAVGYGALQGSSRFALLGAGLITASAGRLVLGGALLWWGFGIDGAMLGLALGLGVSACIALAPFARSALRRSPASVLPATSLLAALLASVAIAMPTSADVLLARHYFSAGEAGAYAAVSVLGKVVIFGPLAISLIFFPLFVRDESEGRATLPLFRLGLLATAGVSVPLTAVVVALGALAPTVLLRGYDTSFLFLATYLAAMLLFSFVVTLLYFNLARRCTRFVSSACLGLAAELAAIALWHPSVLSVAIVLFLGNLLLLTAGLFVSARALVPEESSSLRVRAAALTPVLQD